MIVTIALLHLIGACAPRVGPVTVSAVIAYESRGDPNAIGDNTTRRSYSPGSRARAEALASRPGCAR